MSLPPDDERTVLVSGNGAQAPAAAAAPEATADNVLPVGTRLGEFEITGLLGEGGFGIVYLAYDSSLERNVALKEYMPSAFASRSTTSFVSVKSDRYDDMFQAGLRSFVNEARILAQFDHPSLIKVYRFWEANGTAYMVMPYYQGPTLKQVLLERAERPDEAFLKALLAPLLDTLALIHQQQCFHRDIAPDNILMLSDGRPLLLDFGAARRAISGMQQQFTVIVKHGYAPIEQYAEMPGMSQGAWTDLFALASVVHFAIDGKPPPPAVGRIITDPYVPLAERHADRYSASFLAAIDRALAVKPDDRPQDAAELRALLGLAGGHAPHAPGVQAPVASAPRATPASAAAAPAVKLPRAQATGAARPPAGATRSRPLLIGATVAGIAVVAMAAYLLTMQPPAPITMQAPAALAGTGASASSAPLPPAPPPGAPATAAAPASPLPAAADAAFNPNAALDQVVAGASADRAVTVAAEKASVVIGKDRFNFTVHATKAGYLYVQMVGSDSNNFYLLFPNAVDKNNRIAAGETLKLPRKGWRMDVGGPAGTDRFVAIVSDVPRDFGSAGLVAGDPFSEFPIARAHALQRAYTGSTPLFAGTPNCGKAATCSPAYGASLFTINEIAP